MYEMLTAQLYDELYHPDFTGNS